MNPFLTPEAIIAVGALLLLLWEAFRQPSPRVIAWAAILLQLVAASSLLMHGEVVGVYWEGLYRWDALAIFGKCFFLAAGLCVSVLSLEFLPRLAGGRGEFLILPLFVTSGLLLLTSAYDFILLFVALELITIGFYILIGSLRHQRVALEAAIKYLIMSALSSAFLVMGIAYVFGFTGSTQFQVIKGFIEVEGPSTGLLFGLGLVLIGLGFKIATVPFHLWAPDVYQGAPTPVTAFLGVSSKAAGFILLLRLVELPFGSTVLESRWVPIFSAMAMFSVLLGNLAGLPQRNMKRLLAYSGIAHGGFLLAGLASNNLIGQVALLYYLCVYSLAAFAAFLVITIVAKDETSEAQHLFSGLGERAPLLAWPLAISFLSLAGLPPLAGFYGKYLIMLAVWESQHYLLFSVCLLGAVIGLYFYLGLLRTLFWVEPLTTEKIPVTMLNGTLLILLSASLIGLGVFAQPLLALLRLVL
jgi:NADH-quinone oxidoreductase subunit N